MNIDYDKVIYMMPYGTLKDIGPRPMPVRNLWDMIPWGWLYETFGPIVGLR